MSRLACCVVLLALTSSPITAHADSLGATRSMPLVETSHAVDIKIEAGVATYTVRRQFKNPGKEAEQVELVIGLPYGAAATGLRIKAKDKWFTGELMEREKAAALYKEMTGYGPFAPKDPALLAWMWADTLSLQVFPVMPGTTSTVEYTLTAPTRYMGGKYFVSYPRVATLTGEDKSTSLPLATPVVTVHFGWGDATTRVLVDNRPTKRDTAVALVPPPKPDWADFVEWNAAASYVASAVAIPSNRHTDKAYKTAKLQLDVRHTYKSDVRIELLTPQNQRVDVFDGGGGGTNDIRGQFALELPEGTTAAGTWRLIVSDHVGLDTGTLDRWSLTIGEGADRTVATAADTPMFIPDAPANATEAGVATISVEPPPIAMVTGRLGKVVASKQHAFSRLELDLAPQLVPTPKRAQVVFALDTSYTMSAQGVDAQLQLVEAYATHVPDAEVELVAFQRHAKRVFGRFVPVAELAKEIAFAKAKGAFALGNGSNLDEGALLAGQLLADRTAGPRRVVLATDEMVRDALTTDVAARAVSGLPADTVVHVIVPKLDGDDRATLARRDDADLAAMATRHHGIFADVGGVPARSVKELAPTVLELVRPTRIEKAAVTGFALDGDVLHEGDGVRLMIDTEAKPAPDRVTLSGMLWSDPVTRELAVSRPFSIATAAFVFGGDEHQALGPAEQMTVALMGRAVSPVTSYVAAEPGTRPSPIGLGGFGTIGAGAYGTIGHGSGMGSGFGLSPPRWDMILDTSACTAQLKPPAPWAVTLEIETTREEIVDVRVKTAGALARCLVETAWSLKLDPDEFPDAHHTYTVELSGPAAP